MHNASVALLLYLVPPCYAKGLFINYIIFFLKINYSLRAQLSTKMAQGLNHMWFEACLQVMCLVQVHVALTGGGGVLALVGSGLAYGYREQVSPSLAAVTIGRGGRCHVV